jgi:fatty-acyl-CoA synthase
MLFADRFATLRQTRAGSPAISFRGETHSFGELVTHGWQVGNGLLGVGVPRRDRVVILARNRPEFFELLIGAGATGHALAPLNWRLAPAELAELLDDTASPVLFVAREFYDVAEQIAPQCPQLRHIVALDGGHHRWPDYRRWRDAQLTARPRVSARGEDDLLQLYTSGTTGRPKGVRLTNQGYESLFRALIDEQLVGAQVASVILNVMPLFHVGGVNHSTFFLLRGAHLHLSDDFRPTEVLDALVERRANQVLLVPTMIHALLREPRARERDYSHLRCIYYGAAPIAESLLREAIEVFGCRFAQFYGATENYGMVTRLAPEDHLPERGKLGSCGKPIAGASVRIVNPLGESLPAGEVGELVLKCRWMPRGYWKQPAASAAALAGGWYRTGDAATVDEEGFIYIRDRITDMIISGGENIFPAEVERVLAGHPDVLDVAVIGVPDGYWGEAVKAVVVPRPGSGLGPEQVMDFARARIAAYKVPKSVELVAALPRSITGKIRRRELQEPYWEGRERQVGYS